MRTLCHLTQYVQTKTQQIDLDLNTIGIKYDSLSSSTEILRDALHKINPDMHGKVNLQYDEAEIINKTAGLMLAHYEHHDHHELDLNELRRGEHPKIESNFTVYSKNIYDNALIYVWLK